MKLISQLTALIIGLALLAAIGLGAYVGLDHVASLLASLDAQVARVTVIASVALLLAGWIVARAVRQTARDRMALPMRDEKAATYRLFADVWQRGVSSDAAAEEVPEMRPLGQLLALHGSAAMIESHLALRAWKEQAGAAAVDARAVFARALAQARKELHAPGQVSDDVLAQLLLPGPTSIAKALAEPPSVLQETPLSLV